MGYCKIFDPYPKENREDFFDNNEVLNEVTKLIEGKFWPLLVGPKRTGKTSILKILSKELEGIYVDASGVKTLRGLGDVLLKNTLNLKLKIDLKVISIQLARRPVKAIQELLDNLDSKVIFIDEAQNVVSPWFISILSAAYNTSQVKFAFSGSMIGLSKVLSGKSKKAKFKGRPIVEVNINPWDDNTSMQFLKEGAKRCSINIAEGEIEDAVRTYRGIPGWLTYYGNFRSLGYPHNKAKQLVLNIARNIIKDETEEFGEIEKTIIRALSLVERARWGDLKKVTEALLKREINDASFTHALDQLVNARVVNKKVEDNTYSLIDPLYKEVLSSPY